MNPISSPPRVRLLPYVPLSVLRGGFERACEQTVTELNSLGVPTEILRWDRPDDEYDIMHFFGLSATWREVAFHWSKQGPYVVSALASATIPTTRQRLGFLRERWGCQRTSYERTKWVANNAAKVICLNELEENYFRRRFSLPQEKTVVIPNGVCASRFSATKELFIRTYGIQGFVLYVGNVVERKHPLKLAQVLVRLGLPGVFIGPTLPFAAEYGERFRAYIADKANLLWIEELCYADPRLDSAYAAAAAYCLPSASETQPLAALEAMAAGAPIVLGDRDYAYQAPFEEAVRCRPGDDVSLETAIRKAIEAPRKTLAERYRWPNIANDLATLYSDVVHNG